MKKEKPKQAKENRNKNTSVIRDTKQAIGKEDSDHSKTATILMDERFKRRKTFLDNNRQVGLINTLDVIAQLYDIPFLKKYVDGYMELLTSIGGKGRKDIVDISKFRFAEQEKYRNQLLELANR